MSTPTPSGTVLRRKCDSCGQWNQGRPRLCEHCGKHTDHRLKRDEEREAAKQKAKAEAKAAFQALPKHKQIFKRILKIAETIYLSIVSFIAWLLFWLGG